MNPLQRAAMIRKVSYFAAILVLFTISMVWRGVIPVPLGTSAASAAQPFRWAHNHTIQSQAERLEVLETDPNETEAEVSGSALRLALTGSRGFVVTGLWMSAIEKQKRNDFHEFEQRVAVVTKLQPNFITPWIFQSWNISYNVSVEMHGSGDMYYYIVRGIQLLAEGERRNKRSPDMRYQIAFYYQNKFGVSDQVETLRCLYDLSCMPPSHRNPANLEDPTTKKINYEQFKKFCEQHPHFVRRLRGEDSRSQDKRAGEKLRAPDPKDVIQFLRDNYEELPCRYRKDTVRNIWTDELLADPKPQEVFPVLPPQFNEGPGEAHSAIETPDDFAPGVGYFSAFKAARAWFTYSLVLLPPPLKDDQGNPVPGPTPPPGVGGHDPSKHRVPRLPIMIIFRQGAPRAQTYQAEMEQKEGWFDGEGWRIEGWFPNEPQGVVVGNGRAWSFEEWRKAAELWRLHGEAYALSLTQEQLTNLTQLAGNAATLPINPTPDQLADENFRRRYIATNALNYYRSNRSVTNFPYFLASAQAEAYVDPTTNRPITVLARKTLWHAEQARKIGEWEKAMRLYKEGLGQWHTVLVKNPNFHRLLAPDRGERGEEETYEYELAYFRLLVQYDDRVKEYADNLAHAAHAVVPFLTRPFAKDAGAPDPLWPTTNRDELKWFVVENVGNAPFSSPFVGDQPPRPRDGGPWVREEIKESVRTRQGVSRGPKPPPAPAPDPNAPAPPPPAPIP